MKNLTLHKLFMALIIMCGSIQLVFAQTTHIVNYSIQDWNNATGSFTFETGTMENPITKRNEGYFKITFEDGKIINITPQFIDSFIQKINSSVINSKNTDNLKLSDEKNNAIEKLNQLKLLLEDEVRMNVIITKLQNGDASGLNWDYTVQTIRNFNTLVTGTVE
jgi:hypothetical protein